VIGLGGVFRLAKLAEFTIHITDIRIIEMAVDVEEGLLAVVLLADRIGDLSKADENCSRRRVVDTPLR
jgi:hypothetical protein